MSYRILFFFFSQYNCTKNINFIQHKTLPYFKTGLKPDTWTWTVDLFKNKEGDTPIKSKHGENIFSECLTSNCKYILYLEFDIDILRHFSYETSHMLEAATHRDS